MPNNGSLPNMQMANWIRNFVSNHPQRSIPQPDYKLDNEYNYKNYTILRKSPKSDENTLILIGNFNLINLFTKNIQVIYLDDFGNKTNISDFTFNYIDDILEINLDSSYYSYDAITIIVIINKEYKGVKINETITSFYNKVYIPIVLNEDTQNFLDKLRILKM